MFTTLRQISRHLLPAAIVLLTVLTSPATTNSLWLTRSWQTDDGSGLPDNSINGIAQTADGYLWVGTPTGLARFDGFNFDEVSLANIIAPPNRGVLNITPGAHGALWLGMDRGAVLYIDGASSRAFVDGLPKALPSELADDGRGGVWITYRNGGIFHIRDGQVVPATANSGLPEGAGSCALTTDKSGHVWFAKAGQIGMIEDGAFHPLQQLNTNPVKLAPARAGGIWIGCDSGFYQCTPDGQLQKMGAFSPEENGTTITALLEDHTGAVWIGTSYSGLYRYDHSIFEAISTTHRNILSLSEDSKGNIWAGTYGGGLDCIQRRALTLEGSELGLPFSSVQSITEASDGVIWAVTQNGVLVHKSGGRWDPIPPGATWPGEATCVAGDSHGAVWIGTRQRGLFCYRNQQFTNWGDNSPLRGNTIHTLLAGDQDDLWVGQETPGAILHLQGGKIIKSFPLPADSRIVRAMAKDASGNIWVGTSKGLLYRIAGDQIGEKTPAQDLAPIRCLCTTADGAVWIGYAGAGVGCLTRDQYFEINSKRGLFDDYISHMVADQRGWLWFGANRGVFKVRQRDLKNAGANQTARVHSVHYGRSYGLPSLQGTFGDSPNVLLDHEGKVWLPMQTALVVVDPAQLHEQSFAPTPFLTQVLVDEHVKAAYGGIFPLNRPDPNGISDLASPINVLPTPPRFRRIEFRFTACSLNAAENIQFRYRLTGFDDEWTESDARHAATYSHLPAGNYVFELTACNEEGEWNPVSCQASFVVLPFFWQTWWFRLAVFLGFILGIIAIVRYVSFRNLRRRLRRLEQQTALQKERARIARDIHDDLGANLTQIAFLGELVQQERAEPERAAERVHIISTTARQAIKSLDEIVWAVNPRNDTLAHLLNYAGQFAVDYLHSANIRCRLDFPEQIPAYELTGDLRHNLFLVIKESLHNIVKHSGATEVWLCATASFPALDLTIRDNGRGFESAPDNPEADGLRNMVQRITDIGAQCRIESQPGVGTQVRISLPWSKK